jgi:hypothetical protein
MGGPFSTRRGATLYLLVWMMLGLILSGLAVNATDAGWSHALVFALPLTLVYAIGSGFSAYYQCRAYPLGDKPLPLVLLVMGVSSLVAGTAWAFMGVFWNALWQSGQLAWAGFSMTSSLLSMVFGLGVVLYAMAVVAHYLSIEFNRARLAERRELESKVMAQDAELRMLRTQIDPHFLFNSLNSISALTSIDPAGARQMTLQLADFFRISLGLEAHTKVTLAAESRLVTHFLAIEQVRFGARLAVEQDLDEAALACLLPPMILQPLVENAVKHGIGNLPEGGTVRIVAHRAGSQLLVSVENDADADTPTRPGTGIGISNVRQRLAAAYGHEASIHWTRSARQFRVELRLPAENEEA